jgi:hypothetical protein
MHRLLSICLFTPSTSPFSPLSTSLRFHYSGSRKTVKLHHLGMAAIFSRPWKRWHLQSFTSGAIHRSCWRVSCYMIGRLHGPIVPFSVRQKPVRSCGRGAFCSASHRNQRELIRTQEWSANLVTSVFPIAEHSLQLETVHCRW